MGGEVQGVEPRDCPVGINSADKRQGKDCVNMKRMAMATCGSRRVGLVVMVAVMGLVRTAFADGGPEEYVRGRDVAFGEPRDGYVCGVPARQPRAEILWTRVIANEKGRFMGWPTVCARRNGELLAVFSGDRDGHVCPYGRVQLVRSKDGGETWSRPRTVYSSCIDDRDAGIIELANGDLALFWFSSVCFSGPLQYRRHFAKLPYERTIADCGNFCAISGDGGLTWSKPFKMRGSANHGGIQLRDGRLLMVGRRMREYGMMHWDDPEFKTTRHELTVEESRDNGRTWRQISKIVPQPPYDITQFHEPHVVECADGRLLVQFRCHQDGHHLTECFSADGGLTWSEMKDLPVRGGYPPHLIRLKDGKLLSTYGFRSPEEGERAMISDDDGKSWDHANEIRLCRACQADIGYPSTAQLPDGTLLTVYYQPENKGEPTCIMATKWRITR